jgi:hypothetical protein
VSDFEHCPSDFGQARIGWQSVADLPKHFTVSAEATALWVADVLETADFGAGPAAAKSITNAAALAATALNGRWLVGLYIVFLLNEQNLTPSSQASCQSRFSADFRSSVPSPPNWHTN